jgi:hypothetical protein
MPYAVNAFSVHYFHDFLLFFMKFPNTEEHEGRRRSQIPLPTRARKGREHALQNQTKRWDRHAGVSVSERRGRSANAEPQALWNPLAA